MSDADKAYQLGELVRARHAQLGNGDSAGEVAGRWVVLDEIRNGAGFQASRSADYVAVGLWPSDGLRIIGYEVKASRGDLKRELADPTKAAESGAYCDEWWLVVWERKMLEGFTIPDEWGILARSDVGDDELKVVRKAPKREPGLTVDRHILATLLRASVRATPGAWKLAEAIRTASRRSRDEGEMTGEADARDEISKILAPLDGAWRAAHDRRWNGPTAEELCAFAVEYYQGQASHAKEGAE